MRTIALRLTGTEASKAELEEDGEEVEGMVTNVSKLRDIIMQATKVSSNGFKGFDILKDNGAYKSTYEILLGIAEIYDEIVENDKKTGAKGANLLLETIAGKNRASVAASILQSPEMLKEAYAEAIDAEGSAEIENAKYLDSISGHLEKLKNAWQEVWANTLNRDVINFFLDLGRAILEVVSNIGLIPTLLIAGGGITTLYDFAKNTGIIVEGLRALNAVLTTNTAIKEANTVATEQETKANIENTGSQVAETTADDADTIQTMAQAAATEANVAATRQETTENIKNAASQGVKKGSKKTSIGANLATNFSLLGEAASNAFTAIGGIKGILGGGLAIGGIIAAIQAYDALNISATETAKEAKEISSAFEESLRTIQKHKDSVNELSETYQKLSSGVNTATNANLTLSNDEYSQYLDTCNKIADLYPQLVTGYDLQGNAIINLTNNVNGLRDALIEEQKVAANTFLQGGEKKGIGGFFDNIFGFFGLGNKNSIKDNFNNNYDKYNDIQTIQDQFLNKNNVSLDDYTLFRTDLLGKSLDGDIDATNLLNTLDEISNGLVDSDEKLQIFLNNLKGMNIPPEMQQSIKQAQQTILSELSLNDDYWDLIYSDNEKIKSFAPDLFTNAVNSLSPEKYNDIFSTEDGAKQYANNLVKGINSALSGSNADVFTDAITNINKFISGEGVLADANMGDFSKIANMYKQAFIEAFADSDIDGAEVFEGMFDDKGISELQARFTDVLNSSFTALDSNSRNQAIEFFNSLSKEQAQTYIESFNGAKDLSQVTENYSNKLRTLSANTYEAIVNIEDETNAINTLTSALSSSASGTGLSSEEVTNITSLFSDLASYDEDALIERTANGIHLNVEELEKLNKERAEINLKKQGKELDKYNKELSESEKNLKELKARYDANKMSLEEYQSAYSEENNIKNGILDKINLLEREMAQYSALTSAYNKYVQAQSSANENAKYENIAGGYETTKDLIERGWIGQDDVRAYLNMFTDNDMMTASVQELYDVWDKLDDKINSAGYSAKDFFTFDENNKSTSDGIFNFLDTVRQAAKDSGISDAILDQLVAVDEATGTYSFDFDILGGDQKIADMLGMDLSLLQAIIQAARDAGFEVQMTNALPGVQALTENLRNMRAEVKKLGGDVEKYDFNVLSVDVSDSSEYTSVLDSISGAIKELKETNLDDPLNFAYYNQVNSELETLIGTKARATVDADWGDTNIDQVTPKYQGLVAILDEMYYQQERLKETNAFNEQYHLDVDTSNVQKAFDAVQDDLKKYVSNLSYADAQELGLNVTPQFDEFTAEEKWETVKEQIEEQGGIEVPVDLESPTGDPTKGLDNQKITIDIQFSVDGETLVLKNITGIQQAAENVPEKVSTEFSTTGDGAEETNSFVSDLEKVPTEVKTALKVQEDKKKVAQYKATLDKLPSSVKTQILLTGTSALDSYLTKINNNRNKSIWVDIKARWDKSGLNGMPSSVVNKLSGVWGTANAFGTAYALGTAYARGTSGNWGIPDDQDALVGELGEELVVFLCHYIQ